MVLKKTDLEHKPYITYEEFYHMSVEIHDDNTTNMIDKYMLLFKLLRDFEIWSDKNV